MNYKTGLTTLAFLAILGCKITDQDSFTETYRYVNESGVEVALVGEPYQSFKIQDSIIIKNGNTFECGIGYSGLSNPESVFPYRLEADNGNTLTKSIPIKIYFNKNVCMRYTIEDKGKNPANRDESYNTTVTRKKHRTIYTYTYTFTAEDYQNALTAQK